MTRNKKKHDPQEEAKKAAEKKVTQPVEDNDIPVSHETDADSGQQEEAVQEDELTVLRRENQLLKDKYVRTLAEFENFRRRNTEERAQWIKNATQQLVLEICEVIDNFERALDAGKQEHQFDSFLKGVELIHQQMLSTLKREGVERIEALGKEFDPMYHDAIAHLPSEYDADMVSQVIQTGYIMNNRVIRPAKVIVSNGEMPADATKDNQEEK